VGVSNAKSGRVYAGLNKEERTAQRKQKFIDAGIQLFGNGGFHSTTERKLCAEAELTARYYYESFESTEDLLIAAFDQCTQEISNQITAEITKAGASSDPRDLIIGILDTFFRQMEDRRVARLIMLEVLCVSESVDKFSNKQLGKLGELILTLGRTLYPTWKIDPDAGALLGISILGAMRQATIHWMVTDYKLPRSTVVSTTSSIVFGLLKVIEEQVDNESAPQAPVN